MTDSQIRILTFNCWGLKYVSKNREERIAGIGDVLAASVYDIVALQELWVYSDYEFIKSKVAHRTPHAKFFHSGALGAGLALFSRFPIIGATVHPYSLNGSPIDVLGGDWFVGKAASSIVVAHPILGQLQIFNTHLYAKGGEVGPEHLRAHRIVNAWELAKLTRQSAELGRYVISAGDYNSIPTSFPISLIRDHAALTDAWAHTHPNVPGSVPASIPPLEALHTFGVTADSPHNSYSAGKPLDAYARRSLGKRLDYILYRQPTKSATSVPVLECTESNVVFTNLVPGQRFSYSDHFGLEARFEIHLPGDDTHLPPLTHSLQPSVASSALSTSPDNLSPTSITTMIRALTACYRTSRSRSKLYLTTFAVCLFLLFILMVSSAWLPYPWINPIYIILTTMLAWFATTIFYVGFIYGNWEVNALINIIEELEIHRNGLVQGERLTLQE